MNQKVISVAIKSLKCIRLSLFLPVFLSLLTLLIFSIFKKTQFELASNALLTWIKTYLSYPFALITFLSLLACIGIAVSPMRKIRMGGPQAKPSLHLFSWFAIILCTTVAVGILFWGSAEPYFHATDPPSFAGGNANDFALAMSFLHWTFNPYALYTLPAILLGLGIYNHGRSVRLSAAFYPLIPHKNKSQFIPNVLDALCLLALVLGMSASLGAGVLSIRGGVNALLGIDSGTIGLMMIALAIGISFIISSITGIQKGIKYLSMINLLFFCLLGMLFVLGQAVLEMLQTSLSAVVYWLKSHIAVSLQLDEIKNSEWSKEWSGFYWANWMAWAPITAIFIAKISYGRRLSEILLFVWVLPSFFVMLWMAIFGSATLVQLSNHPHEFINFPDQQIAENILYRVINLGDYSLILTVLFLILMFISFVTAADSTTDAIVDLHLKDNTIENSRFQIALKLVWGVLITAVATSLVAMGGIDGVRMLSNFGGVPGGIFFIGCIITAFLLICQSIFYKVH
ncbi:MAG: BCCT family transporter [Cyclobacteriaceae bacterium]|nr:BCCT family transporter [Cyclobacteriaceae bacterium]MCH8516949.1 BCCT family transporter [Cyclobacteriaceae bacterium]